jgi:HAD superfamily hydrolase (TIGR01484 family)
MLSDLPSKKIRGIFTDLDDTLTENSQVSSETYRALCRLKEHGFWIAIVSGRPAGWADCLMRLWPLDAMIFENGAGLVTRQGPKLEVTSFAGPSREDQHRFLEKQFSELKRTIPSLKLSQDQPYRLYDYAIDYAEEPPYLSPDEVKKVLDHLASVPTVTAKLSSIHINYWVGSHTKVTAVRYLMTSPVCPFSPMEAVFIGDSPNDEPLFEFFEHSVGVANVQTFLGQMKSRPKYVTESAGGRGFQELADHLTGSLTKTKFAQTRSSE